MEFTETLTLEIPRIENQLESFAESTYSQNHGLIIEIAAIHEGLTANYNYYSASELEAALHSWTLPYEKPIILHHDPYTEPMGRVIGAKMDKEDDGTPYVRLQVAVTDPTAVDKIKDKRYLTGSVGGKAGEARCSVCKADWANASMASLPCRHQRGQTYKGKLASLEMGDISFKEYSFVNMPADERSGIRATLTNAESANEERLVMPAKFYSLDFAKESVVELAESESREVLTGLKKKEATPLYLGLKGSFLSALATSAENDNKEINMAEAVETEVTDEEDILAVAEELSADLASETEQSEDHPEDEEKTPATPPEDEEEPEAPAVSDEDGEPSEDEEEETPVEEEGTPEGQETGSGDVDPEDSGGAPPSRESEEEVDDTASAEEEEVTPEESSEASELQGTIESLESRVAELETRESSLLEENTKLKAALKRNLAERVVDTKIALGLSEQTEREALLEEHVTRSASSLADSLRDLASMEHPHRDYSNLPKVTSGALGTKESGPEVETEEVQEDDVLDPEEVFFEAFMGRRTL